MGLSLKDLLSCAISQGMSSEQNGQGMTDVRGLTPTNQFSISSDMWSNTFDRNPALIMSFFSSLMIGLLGATTDVSTEEVTGLKC